MNSVAVRLAIWSVGLNRRLSHPLEIESCPRDDASIEGRGA